MSDSLIQVILNDKSNSVSTTLGTVGATVIKATRGGSQPVLFLPKQSKRIVDYFGIPDTGSEAIDDVINYNNSYPIWVSAPSTDGTYGGVLVTKTGTTPFLGGKADKVVDFTEIDNIESVTQVPDGVITNFTKTLTDFADYTNTSIDILVSGVSISVTATDAEPEILTTSPDVGSGTYTRATGVLDFTFTTAPLATDTVQVQYKTDKSSTAYFALFNKNAQADDLAVKVVKNTDNTFAINLYKKLTTGSYSLIAGFPKTASTVLNTKDGFGVNIYLEQLFKDSDYITPVVNSALTVSTFVDDTSNVIFAGGVRGTTDTAALTAGWDYFKATNSYKANIFFDTTADSAIPSIFLTLRQSYQTYAYYILPTTNVSASDAITAYTSLMTDEKGLAFYWGWGKIVNPYTGALMASSLMGRRALRLAFMDDVFNGLAPAWFNENGRHGGQLGSGIAEMFFDADETQQAALEAARINPTILHSAFGVVNTRERTSQSLQSDFASIGHTRFIDYLISNITEQALPYQLYKLNDFSHRSRVKAQIDSIIAPTAAEPYNLIRDYIVKCDEENNDDEVLAREEFVVGVAVKLTPFAKFIKLYFTVTAQGATVSEEV